MARASLSKGIFNCCSIVFYTILLSRDRSRPPRYETDAAELAERLPRGRIQRWKRQNARSPGERQTRVLMFDTIPVKERLEDLSVSLNPQASPHAASRPRGGSFGRNRINTSFKERAGINRADGGPSERNHWLATTSRCQLGPRCCIERVASIPRPHPHR